jgi:hypothetical protein
MGDAADDACAGDPYITGDVFGSQDDGPFYGRRQYRAPKCTNGDVTNAVENILRARKNTKPIAREVLDKHVAEIGKIRFNHTLSPGDIELAIEDLMVKVAHARGTETIDLYRRITLYTILLADAAENGKW